MAIPPALRIRIVSALSGEEVLAESIFRYDTKVLIDIRSALGDRPSRLVKLFYQGVCIGDAIFTHDRGLQVGTASSDGDADDASALWVERQPLLCLSTGESLTFSCLWERRHTQEQIDACVLTIQDAAKKSPESCLNTFMSMCQAERDEPEIVLAAARASRACLPYASLLCQTDAQILTAALSPAID